MKYMLSIPHDLHRRLKIRAAEDGKTIRQLITAAIEALLERGPAHD